MSASAWAAVWLALGLVWPCFVGVAAYRVMERRARRRRAASAPVMVPSKAALGDWETMLRRNYPLDAVPRLLAPHLPTERRPPWWRPFRRARWARRLDAAIGAAALYGWRKPLAFAEITRTSPEAA